MSDNRYWYVIQQPDGTCKVAGFSQEQTKTPEEKQWGSYQTEAEAIAKRIGLIRAGKCLPQ